MTRRSSLWRGAGCGATRGHARPESTEWSPAPSSFGAGELLAGLRDDLKARRFVPMPVREKMIPKASGQDPPPGHPDRRATGSCRPSLKLVLEPIFEADFKPCSLRLPPEAPSPGRDRRDPLPRLTHSELRVGVRGRHQGVLRRDRPHGPHGPGAASDRGQACPGPGEGVPARPASSPRTASTGTRSPAHPKAGSSHRCWPTSPCPCSTSTSPRSGKRSARNGHAPSTDAPVARS